MSTKHEGWYPDPADASRFRWWTGLRWTNWLSDSDASIPPPIQLPGTASERPQVDRARGFVPTLVAGLVVLALVLGTFTALGMRTNAAEAMPSVPRMASYGPAVERAHYHENRVLSYRPKEQLMLLREATVPLPQAPFTMVQESTFAGSYPGVFKESVAAQYESGSKVITVMTGLVEDGAVTWNDPALGGAHIAKVVADSQTTKFDAQFSEATTPPARAFGQREGYPASVTASLTDSAGKRTTLDARVWLFELEFDTWYAWLEIEVTRPEDDPPANEAAAQAALDRARNGIEFVAPAPR